MKAPTILLTRPQKASERFAVHFSVPIVISPLLQILPNGLQLSDGYSGCVIFTSANAVALAGDGAGRRAHCVGEYTAKVAAKAGWQLATIAPDADTLVAQMKNPTEAIHLCGQHRRGQIVERLAKKGFAAKHLVLYDQQALSLTLEAHEVLKEDVIAPLFSPRTAEILANQQADLARAHLIAFSPAVAEPLSGVKGASLSILAEPSSQLMIKSIEKLIIKGSP